ncbi:MAG: 2-keto-4-pentenoate hydratase/2-oxohepta-3-ene-1,7-dioic acid hydratase in catechol pathway [Bacteroidia bacterium]|jgi:2-keto-4-pentenoate hydratase/2-oxohepta-3-ene-1,7-dioic acid hydratase in catechol pathway
MRSVQYDDQSVLPSKIVCAGRNYVAHIEELGNEVPDELVIFLKPNSAISNTLHSELGGEALHYEAELAFMVVGGELVAVGLGLDLTKRTLQSQLKNKGLPWERAKSFDGSALFSGFITLEHSLDTLELQLFVDDKLRQRGGVSLMLHPPAAILTEMSTFTTLEDHDIIMTGTPAGVGQVNAGECFRGQVMAGNETLLEVAWTAH